MNRDMPTTSELLEAAEELAELVSTLISTYYIAEKLAPELQKNCVWIRARDKAFSQRVVVEARKVILKHGREHYGRNI